jgi:hypothetical protein
MLGGSPAGVFELRQGPAYRLDRAQEIDILQARRIYL